ncbi:hypothetical protein [Agrococcus sp. ProA11]|uniref:hypothetical protein n=1 Tax=Agrococcus chionoecetis TaxID=3153752 RepID=UPI0032619589
MPLKRESKPKERAAGAEPTLESVAEKLAEVVDEAMATRDLKRLAKARKLSKLDRLYLGALRRRAAGELQPRPESAAPPLEGGRLLALAEIVEARVRLMTDGEANRKRRHLKAAGELSQLDALYLSALRERRLRSKNLRKENRP